MTIPTVSHYREAPRDPGWSGTEYPAIGGLDRRFGPPAMRFRALAAHRDPSRMSAREMTELSLALYLDGLLRFDEYALLAVQPELHPDFNRTIGAITGQTADPDRPRDFIRIWAERLDFEHRHAGGETAVLRRLEGILAVLRHLCAREPVGA